MVAQSSEQAITRVSKEASGYGLSHQDRLATTVCDLPLTQNLIDDVIPMYASPMNSPKGVSPTPHMARRTSGVGFEVGPIPLLTHGPGFEVGPIPPPPPTVLPSWTFTAVERQQPREVVVPPQASTPSWRPPGFVLRAAPQPEDILHSARSMFSPALGVSNPR